MAVIEGIVVIAIILGIILLYRSRLPLRREREAREYQIKILTASRELVELLMVDTDIAQRIFVQLEQKLRVEGKLPVAENTRETPDASRVIRG